MDEGAVVPIPTLPFINCTKAEGLLELPMFKSPAAFFHIRCERALLLVKAIPLLLESADCLTIRVPPEVYTPAPPLTSSLPAGLVVPIPTLPLSIIVSFSVKEVPVCV